VNFAYAAIMASAVGVGFWAARLSQSRLALSRREKWAIGLGAYCGAMIGAKLPFVLSDWDGLRSGVAWFSDGKTILCGLVGGYFGVEIAKWCFDIRLKTGDTFAVPIPLAVAVGRLGCFEAGCCYGTPTGLPWGVVFPTVDGLPRHPTQLYESAFHLACAAVLFALRRRGLFRGQLIKLYIIAYAVYRFVTEFIRPEDRVWHGLTGYQIASVVIVALFAGLWIRDARLYFGTPATSAGPTAPGAADSLSSS
jgi:phosphatidylglycerol:prolipoprotein diacylglycerol transferase